MRNTDVDDAGGGGVVCARYIPRLKGTDEDLW